MRMRSARTRARFAAFFHEMLQRGVLLAPSQFEALFVSAAHHEEDIDRTIAACREALAAIAPWPCRVSLEPRLQRA